MASTSSPDMTSFRFSTRNLPPKQRLSRWNEAFGRPLSRRLLSPPWASDGPFHVEMTGRALGGQGGHPSLHVMRMMVTAGGMAERSRDLLADGNDDIVLHIHETGRRIVSQFGREATADTGAGLLTSNADTSTIVLPDPARFVSVALPRKLMMTLAPGLED